MTSQAIGLAIVIGAGIGAQWLAWRLRLPAILLLLVAGIFLGPATGVLDPDALFGRLLLPLVSLSVGIILFEGGLSLSFADLREVGPVIRNLVTAGAVVTALLTTLAARVFLGFSWEIALLLGAILSVTGPTVIQPLLRTIRPIPRVNNILKWEGILIDPVGALLAVLVFELLLAGESGQNNFQFLEFGASVVIGAVIGVVGAGILVLLVRLHQVPDFLESAFALAVVVGVFSAANLWQEELGLLSTTAMGIALANQRFISIRNIVEFKEHLRVLILSSLFVILAARLQVADLQLPVWPVVAFLAAMFLIVRPACVWISSLGGELSRKEKSFLAWMAPRGIVAAAVSSVFADRLQDSQIASAELLVPVTFLTIISTVTIYGLTSGSLARALKLAESSPQGVLLLGAHSWARDIATALTQERIRVVVVDSNWQNVTAARMKGIPAHYGGLLSERVLDEIELYGLARLLALTSNDEANSLAAIHFRAIFGQREVYQLAPGGPHKARRATSISHLRGQQLFGEGVDFQFLNEQFAAGAALKKTKLTKRFDYEDFRAQHGNKALPLFGVSASGRLSIIIAGEKPRIHEGQTLIALVPRQEPVHRDESASSQEEKDTEQVSASETESAPRSLP